MRRHVKKLSVLLALILAICQLPAFAAPVSAAGDIIDVRTAAELKAALQMNGDCTILLLDNIDEKHGRVYEDSLGYNCYEGPDGNTLDYKMPVWCRVGTGRKTLDLNGCTFRLEYKNMSDLESDLFYIGRGADLTVKDSHGTSYVTYDGYIGGGWYMPDDSTLESVRNLFHVEGGSLTISGGCFEAGRSKEEWVTNALWNGEETMHPFTGNARKGVNGCAIIMGSGKTTIYGGNFTGRGYTDLRTSGLGYSKRAACIDAAGGELTIIEGYFAGRGGADCIRTGSSCVSNVKGGKFQVFTNKILMLPVPSREELLSAYDGGHESNIAALSHYNVTDGIYGRLFSQGALDYDKINITYYFDREYDTDRRLSRSLGSYGTLKAFFEEWDRTVTFNTHLGYEPYVVVKPDLEPGEIIIQGHENEVEPWINPDKEGLNFVYEYEPAFGRASELNGSPLTVTYTYSLYDCNQAVSKLITSINYGANSGPIDFLSWTPAKEALKKDGRYAIKASVVEDYWTPVYSYLAETDASYYAKNTFIVTHSDPPGVKSQTRGLQLASKKGGTVTLEVTGTDGIQAATWLRVSDTGSVSRAGLGTLSGNTSTYSPVVNSSDRYQCIMRSVGGDVYSEPVEVCFKPAFQTPSSARTREGGSAMLVAKSNYDGGVCKHVISDGWYKLPEGWSGGPDGLTPARGSVSSDGSSLTIKNVSSSDYGEYVRLIKTSHGDYFSDKMSLSLGSAVNPNTNIKFAEINGLKYNPFMHTGLYAGIPAPPRSWLYSDNPFIHFDSLEWTSTTDGKLNDGTSYKLTITAKDDYYFELNDRGGLAWSMDGTLYHQAGLGSPGDVIKTVTLNSLPLNLPLPEDRIDYSGVIQGKVGEAGIWEHMCFLDCQLHDTPCKVTGMSVHPDDRMPFGLTFSWFGNDAGEGFKVFGSPEEAGIMTTRIIVKLSSGYEKQMELNFVISDAEPDYGPPGSYVLSLPAPPPHVHEFEDFRSDGPKTHSMECPECGYKITEEHVWDDGTIVREASAESAGLIRYICVNCGETKEESIKYDIEASGAMTEDQAAAAQEMESEPAQPSTPDRPAQPDPTEEPQNGAAFPFVDVPEDSYYHSAVEWALTEGVTGGTTPTTFSPKAPATRAQMIVFLWAASGAPAPKTTENPFVDVSEDAYYYQAVLWAVENGITAGVSADAFGPDRTVTRAQAATFLYGVAGHLETGTEPFDDVNDSDYFEKAVAWAFAEGITTGMSETLFSPDADCLREQIITFMYLYFGK